MEELTKTKEYIDEESPNLKCDSTAHTKMITEFQELAELIRSKIENLTFQDKELGLHTLAPLKVKENVVYPEPFTGTPGEDVFRFTRDFKEAIQADHNSYKNFR